MPPLLGSGDLVANSLASHFPLELGEGEQHVQGQPTHARGRVELLGYRDEGDALCVEGLHNLGEVEQRTRQTVDFINDQDIVTVRVTEAIQSKQGLPIFTGISANTARAKGLSLVKVVIPPGGSAEAHVHKGYESAVYLLQGRVETRYGEGLKKSVMNVAGDFVFIPPDVPHQPFNLSDTEPAIAIVARNDPNEQEHVVLYPKRQ